MANPPEFIPGLPHEIALECLSRLHYSSHGVAARVSKQWLHLFQTRDFYHHRKNSGQTHKVACFIQSFPSIFDPKPIKPLRYGITMFDPVNRTWERVDPLPNYPNGLPIFSHITSSEGKLVIMGGWDPDSYEPLSHVFVYDFTTRKWRRGKDMPEKRSFCAIGELNGRVFIAGGHDENKNALSSARVYDVAEDEWGELPPMSQERDECEGVVIGSGFWVVSGYRTENQGEFEGSAEVIGVGEVARGWKRVEGAWGESGSPKWCVQVAEEGRFERWGGAQEVGKCGVRCGEWALMCGPDYEGGPQGFYEKEGQNGKWKRMDDVPDEFCGVVQTGCFVDI
ncbi:Galactose oxidase/kelch repeat superfamily protein [Euphorbia peplus]|nr:Galactose oxidase/kelch repeat superfamily protein [Euphorbia peplus]